MNDAVEQQLQRVYLSNALDQVLANPTAPHVWHLLAPRFFHCGPVLQPQILKLLQENTPADGVAGFLRASFCASLLQDEQFFAEAGAILLALQPPHLDRLNAFLVYAWARLLAKNSTMPQFAAALQNAHAPALIEQMAQMVQRSMTQRLPARPIEAVKKIALIAPHMGTLHHAPTRLLLDHIALLMEQGIEVQLFCCQEMRIPYMSQLLGNAEDSSLSDGEAEEWGSILPGPLSLHLGNPQLGLLRRFVNMLEPLAAFDPDLLMFVGMYSPLLDVLYPQRPVLALGLHAMAPLVSCDVWLCNERAQLTQTCAPWQAQLAIGAAFYYPYRIRVPAPQPMHRQQLGLADDALVLVCAGYRLAQEINGAWAQQMVQFLRAHPETVLLLVGSEELPPVFADAEQDQVQALPHQDCLGGVLACCDIYVNPPRMGGGFSVLEAMASAMPVLALTGADGGNKLGDLAQPDLAAYFAALEQLSLSAELRLQAGNALRTRFYAEYDLNHAAPSLLAACEQARLHYLARTRASA